MKRNIVIAAVASAALITGGTVTAVAASNGDSGADAASVPADVQVGDDDGRDDDSDDRDDGRDDRDDDDRAEAEALAAAKVGVDDAIAAALQERAGTVESAEFDGDDRGGAHKWEIDILGEDGKWYEVNVDAASGDVVADRADDSDDRDDRDDRDDDRDDKDDHDDRDDDGDDDSDDSDDSDDRDDD
ncbi:PepSY domain-containing protein [Streptomyces phytophilus]|uniref:PepSY domain-containing protein n=1 Tax=Streptomyces phytophilus TaxID=722715 RepID=UPI0015F0ABBF|nr:PepSY domain-containing protein [Streptomyces phytophilus]